MLLGKIKKIITGIDETIISDIENGVIGVQKNDNFYSIQLGDKKFDIKRDSYRDSYESGGSDSEIITYLYNELDLDDLGKEGKELKDIIKAYNFLEKRKAKEEHKKLVNTVRNDINEVLINDPIITKNNNLYSIQLGDKKFDIKRDSYRDSYESGGSDSEIITYLYNELDLDDLGKEGKELKKIIRNYEKSIIKQAQYS